MELLGFPDRESLLNTNISKFYVNIEDRAQWLAKMHQDGIVRDFETQLQRRDGEIIYVKNTAVVIRDAAGETHCLEGSLEDITEYKKAEMVLVETQRMYSSLVETSQDLIWRVDLEGKFDFLNEAWVDLLGYKLEDMIGTPIFKYKPEDVLDSDLEVFISVREGNSIKGHETKYITSDGREVELVFTAVPRYDKEGKIIGTQGTAYDITERKQAEEELREYQERLEEMVTSRTQELRDAQEQLICKERLAVLGELAGSVGHELRNPMTGISNAVYYLQLTLSESDETLSDYLGIISQEVQNASNIVNALLDLARDKPPEKQETSIFEIVTQVLGRYPAPKNVRVETKIAPKLPYVCIDATQIGQAINNLITNAYQAMPDGGKLAIKASKKDKQVHLSFTDNGKGISKENLEKIFEPLFTTKARGIGLGLALSKRLVEANGGELEVESHEGKGSTFFLTLPTNGE